MRKLLILVVLTGIIVVAGCSATGELSTPTERDAQTLVSGQSPALAFQINASFALGVPGQLVPFFTPLGQLGLTAEEVLQVIVTGSLVNACMPVDVDVPEWDEWLLASTLDVDVPEWDEWLLEAGVHDWESWLLDVDVPEWDEWLLKFDNMPKHLPTGWMPNIVPRPVVPFDVDVPEWDEWLLHLSLNQIATSYNFWMRLQSTSLLIR